MKVLIIEDEALSRQELILQLKRFPSFEVVQSLDSVEDSVAYLRENQCELDLIFMDIELADGACFEIFESVDVQTPIIFLTAYNQFALEAFKVNSIDYLLKPLNPRELKRAIAKFERLVPSETANDLILADSFQPSAHQRILIQLGDTYQSIDFEDIWLLKSEDKYVTIHTHSHKKYLTSKSLNQLESELPTKSFFRINRQFIIHIHGIAKVSKYLNNRLIITATFQFDEKLIVSRNRVNACLLWMGK
ncbi:LytTR family DNA-binding domain-containing protein [Pontibacter sp. G13]|uniref:LytR/AlgR family response regulator transcription factor n=1 Tax=Pontibacter sp. G13 TaxID=3074898 RepID=UPI00288B70E4|nr:LytTR family DNA-binding domain-containing protein [Pontibacter sp. G13]WNJ18275.1 LytTR family DNA-binding domain-containing protein [Pontibacter sp. G13]